MDSGAYLLDVSAHGRIRASGEDRARLIHALSTNHIEQLRPGEGAYAFFLTAQGRILADAHVLCFAESLLLDVEPGARNLLTEHIDHYIIADDVTLADETESTFALALEGRDAATILRQALALPAETLPTAAESHTACQDLTLARMSATGLPGFRIYGPAARATELREQLVRAGASADTSLHALRIANFQPRWGDDFADRTLPQETGLPHALHFRKGCYLGQEIVERIRSRGHVNRMLFGLRFAPDPAPDPGTKVSLEGSEIGEITSAEGNAALAMLRVQNIDLGTLVSALGRPATTQPLAAPAAGS